MDRLPDWEIRESERRLIQKELFRLEDQKEAAERRFQAMFQNALVGLFRGDVLHRRLTDANLEAARTFGFESVESLILHVNSNLDLYNFFSTMPDPESLDSGNPYSFSTRALRRDGQPFWAQFSVRYIDDGRFIEGAVKDITDQVESMDRLRRAKAVAEEASQAKSRFLATMSHEIRTPLNGVVGFAEILLESGDNTSREYARKILDESDRLMMLISELLDFSRLEANKISLEHIAFDLHEILNRVGESATRSIGEKEIHYITDMEESVPRRLIGDPMRLMQVLSNLLSNAVKFTESGTVSIGVRSLGTESGAVRLRFEVSDTGIGIPPDKIELIFTGFEQADTSISRRYGGTGLGLTISRDLVTLMGGRLEVESTVGVGSTFHFVVGFPVPADVPGGDAAESDAVTSERDILEKTRVLVVEDYDTNRNIACHHLEKAGCRVFSVGNGQEAVDFLTRREPVDLIFMDVHMPGMDGLEATRTIRRLGFSTPIVGMTASAYTEDRERCMHAGMNGFLTKPIRRQALLESAVSRIAAGHRVAAGFRPDEDGSRTNLSRSVTSPVSLRYNDFLTEMDGDVIVVDELLEGFVTDTDVRLIDAAGALGSGDLVRLHRQIHSIKGGAQNLAADELALLAQALERDVKNALSSSGPLTGLDGEFEASIARSLENLRSAWRRMKESWKRIREQDETDEEQPGPLQADPGPGG